jgi:hypothetical protein
MDYKDWLSYKSNREGRQYGKVRFQKLKKKIKS